MCCQMTTVAQAFLAFLAVLLASSHSEASAPAFAGVVDPALLASQSVEPAGLAIIVFYDTMLHIT
eukprot:COSAG01_NODE_3312_length_6277_cov_34.667368_4_plen_65_part_00